MGNEFTPFRDIWQQLAGDLGITTKRMRENRLDLGADQEARLRNANMALAEVIRTGSPEEQAVAAQQMRDVAQATSANLKGIDRTGKPQYNIPAAGELVAPVYDARERGRIAAETDAGNKAYELAKQRRDEFHNDLTKIQDALESVQTNHNTFVEMLNGLGADDPAVQSRYRDLIGMSSGEAKGESGPLNIGIKGLASLNLGGDADVKFTYDQMAKGAARWLKGQTDPLVGYQQAKAAAAVKSGFTLDPSGGLLDVGVPQYRAPVSRPDVSASNAGVPTVPNPPGANIIRASDQPPAGAAERVARGVFNALDPDYVAQTQAAQALGAPSIDAMTLLPDGRAAYQGSIYEPPEDARARLRAIRARRYNKQHVEGVIQRPVNR
jgi:hypothetical protein